MVRTATCLLTLLVLTASRAVAQAEDPIVIIETSMGTIEARLLRSVAPKTVENFIGLAEGTKEFRDPQSGALRKGNFYDGLIFHRVIKKFMIQGGCPLGNGSGGPGYQFADEINAVGLGLDKTKAFDVTKREPNPLLGLQSQADFMRMLVEPAIRKLGIDRHNQPAIQAREREIWEEIGKMSLLDAFSASGYVYDSKLEACQPLKGYLAMANSGPATNGSQFFINLEDTPWLAGKHTVFGKVISGFEIVEKIGEVAVEPQSSRPLTPVTIKTIRVKR